MGLFDRAFDEMESGKGYTKTEAFAGVMLAAVACDGHISDDEVRGLGTIASRMRLFEGVAGPKFTKMMDRLMGVLKRHGVETLLDKCIEALPEHLKETAFAAACDLVLADQGIEEDEKVFLNDLQSRLEIERETALKIFKVMAIKNKG